MPECKNSITLIFEESMSEKQTLGFQAEVSQLLQLMILLPVLQ